MTTETTPIQFRMVRYPHAGQVDGVWSMTRDPLPELRDDEVTVRISYLSVDPGMRGWITPKRSYMPPVQPGEVMRAFGVGEVVESRSERLKVGDWVTGFTGVQTLANLPANGLRAIDPISRRPSYSLAGWE